MATGTKPSWITNFFRHPQSRVLFVSILGYSLALFFFLYLMDLRGVRGICAFLIALCIMLQAHYLGVVLGYQGEEKTYHRLPFLTPLMLAVSPSLVVGALAFNSSLLGSASPILFFLTVGVAVSTGYGYRMGKNLSAFPTKKNFSSGETRPIINDGSF